MSGWGDSDGSALGEGSDGSEWWNPGQSSDTPSAPPDAAQPGSAPLSWYAASAGAATDETTWERTPESSWYSESAGPGPVDRPVAPVPNVVASPSTPAPPTPPGPVPAAPPMGTPPIGPPPVAALSFDTPTLAGPPAAAPPSKGRAKGLLIAGLLAAGLGYGGYVGYGVLFGSSAGADSPEAAVQRLIDGIDHGDVAGVLAAASPSELGGVGKVGKRAASLANATFDKTVSGTSNFADVTISGVELESEELAPGVAKVTIKSLKLSATIEGSMSTSGGEGAASGETKATLRIRNGNRVSGMATDGHSEDTFDERLSDAFGPDGGAFAIVLEQPGGWYISPLLTAAEYTRLNLDSRPRSRFRNKMPEPEWDLLADPDEFRANAEPGSAKPEDAVDDIVDWLVDGDVESLLGSVPSDTGSVFAVFRRPIETVAEGKDLSRDKGFRDAFENLSVNGSVVANDAGIARYQVDEMTFDDNSMSFENGSRCDSRKVDDGKNLPIDAAFNCFEGQDVPLLQFQPIVAVREVSDGGKKGWKVDPILSLVETAKSTLDLISGPKLAAALGSLSVERDPAHVVEVKLKKGTVVSAAPKFDSAAFTVFDVSAPPGSTVQFWPVDKSGHRTALAEGDDPHRWGMFAVATFEEDGRMVDVDTTLPRELVVRSDTGKLRIGVRAYGGKVAEMKFAITEPITVEVPKSGVKLSLPDAPISLVLLETNEDYQGYWLTMNGVAAVDEFVLESGEEALRDNGLYFLRLAPFSDEIPESVRLCDSCEGGTRAFYVLRDPKAKDASITLEYASVGDLDGGS